MSKAEDDPKPSEKKYEVKAITLQRIKDAAEVYETGHDEQLHKFAQEFEDVLNHVNEVGGTLTHMRWVDERGIIIVADLKPDAPKFPFAIPMPVPDVPEQEDEEKPELLPALSKMLGDFAMHASSNGIVSKTERESLEMEQFLVRRTSSVSVDSIKEYVSNLRQVCEWHMESCEKEECDMLHILQLAKQKLEELVRNRIQ
jgi:hypothetical protein